MSIRTVTDRRGSITGTLARWRDPGYRASPMLLAILLAAAATPAAAADAPAEAAPDQPIKVADASGATTSQASGTGGVEEITVVGRHRAENKQDVPIPISAISGKTLDEEHVSQLVDFKNVVPGFNLVNSNPRVSAVVLRGVGGNASNDGSESGVGLIIDNVFYTHVGFAWLNLTDLDHIEMLRGPQGTLLGKNTTVGALDVTTNKPSFDTEAEAELNITNHNGYFFRGYATGTLIPNVLAARISGYTDNSDGFILDHYNNNLEGDHRRWGVRGQLLYTPNDNIDDRLIVGYYNSNEYSNYTSTLGVNSQYYKFLAARVPTGVPYAPDIGPYDFQTARQDRLPTHIDGVSNELNYHLDDVTLTSVSAYEYFEFRPLNGGANIPFPTYRSGYDVDDDQFSQEFRVASSTGGDFDWQGGLYGLREFIGTIDRTIYWQDAADYYLTSAAHPNPALLNGVEADKWGKADTTSIAAYLHGTWHVTDELDLTAGARDTLEWKYAADPSTFTGAENSPNLAETVYLLQTSGLTGIADSSSGLLAVKNKNGTYSFVPYHMDGALSATETHNSASFLVNPSYKIAPNILFYLAGSTGEKSGASVTNALAFANATGQVVPIFTKPETSVDYEFGFKTDWFDKRLEANINFYDNHIYNYQTSVAQSLGLLNGIQQFANYLSTAGQVRLRGVEFEGKVVPTEDLSVTFNAALNDARYVAFSDAPNPYFGLKNAAGIPYPTSTDPYASLTGHQIPNAPRISGNITVNYQHPVTDDLIGYVWVNQSYRGRVYFTSSYLPANYQTDYGLTDFGLGVKAADGTYSVEFFMRNALNLRYAVSVTGSASPTGANTATLGDPRYFGGKLTYHFGESAPEPEAAAPYTPPPVQPPAPAVARSYQVFFDFNKSDLTAEAVKVVDQAATNAGPAKATQITVTGHTDTVGSDAFNLRLGKRRAESVAEQLEKDGIPASEIQLISKGKHDLLVPTGDGVREPQNRRVTIVYEGGPVA